MKLPRVSAVVAAAVLAPTVLFPSMASAADNPQPAGVSGPDIASKGTEDQGTGQEEHDRAEVRRILADKETGPAVRAAGEKALAGTAADVRHFLDVELDERRQPDNRLKVVWITNGAGPVLKKAADKALRGSYQDILDFLKEGQFTARAEDEDRAEVQGILADKETGPAVRAAGEKALAGTAADVRHFLDVELGERRQADNRVMVARIFDGAGPAVKAAARKAISGSNQEVLAFLKEGQFIARAEDEARAEVQGILDDKETGPGVRAAGEKALAGTAADVRHFLDVELDEWRQTDNRLKVVRISDGAGPALSKAADKALRGSYQDILDFLKEGQFTARAEDEAANKPAPQPARPAEQPQTATGAQPAVRPAALTTTTDTTATATTAAGTTAGTATATTGATTVTARPGQLAATGTEGLGWEAGGAAAALAAGAALVVASRRRSTES
ncbi:ALF repeat-containing protein [Kitasatospora sp. NPDC056731]|uniref:ALF repeat-containing protein n=1 Tax=Kitasatospora sp. NPDC056731 TaxID=3155422 RepID=UPI003420D909